MNFARSIRSTVGALLLMTSAIANAATMTVFKSPTCGCCAEWIKQMRAAGLELEVFDVDNIMATKARLGVPEKAVSCHTSTIGGYVVEGHVPAADIKRLLATRPKARGIAVAGMPMGAPGMEHGNHREPYQTLLLKADGTTSVFASH